MSRGWESSGMHARKKLDCLEETVGKNKDVKGNFGKRSERKLWKKLLSSKRYTHIVIINRMLVDI